MKIVKVLVIVLVSIALIACATKRYPIATPLSTAEAKLMTCDSLALELLKADQVERQINETGEFDGRTVLGFLGDLGIGNAMAKDEARTAISQRRITVREAQQSKGCTQ